MFPQWFKSHIICAGLPGERDGTCHGDSGGPLAQFIDNEEPHYVQFGKFFLDLETNKLMHIKTFFKPILSTILSKV